MRPLLSVCEAPGPLPPPSRQRERLPRSEAPSIDKCSLIAFAERARHRTHSFAAAGRLPALFRPSRRSRGEELDPDGGDGLFTRGRPDRAPLVNFCNRNEMRAQSLDQSNPAHRAGVAFGAAFAAGGRDPFRSSAGRDVTGQGRLGVNHARASSHHDRSRRKLYPNPIRLGHLLSQTCFRRGLEKPPPKMCPAFEGHPQGRRAGSRFRETPPFRAASHTPPRREAHYAAPEVPFIARPTPDRARLASPALCLGERGEAESRRLFIHRELLRHD
jgi:hypothetical protein